MVHIEDLSLNKIEGVPPNVLLRSLVMDKKQYGLERRLCAYCIKGGLTSRKRAKEERRQGKRSKRRRG